MNQRTRLRTIATSSSGKSKVPVILRAISATAIVPMNWAIPSVPMPRILPPSNCQGRTLERRTSTTLLDFSSVTPVRIHVP